MNIKLLFYLCVFLAVFNYITAMNPKNVEDISKIINSYQSKNTEKLPLRKIHSEIISTKKSDDNHKLTRTNSAPIYSQAKRFQKLIKAIKASNQSDVKKYISEDIINHTKESEQETPLMHAVCFNNGTIVAMLLKHGANPNRTNQYGNAPLHIALMQKNINPGIIQLLLDAQARIELTNNKGETPLDLFKIAKKNNPALKSIVFEQQ